jgi:hypothetical protein
MMVYRFCVLSDAQGDDPYAAFENSLIYAAYLRERDPEAAALLVDRMLPAMVDNWYAEQGEYPPVRDHLLHDLAECAPDIAEVLRQAQRIPDVRARLRAAQRLLARLRGEREAAAG